MIEQHEPQRVPYMCIVVHGLPYMCIVVHGLPYMCIVVHGLPYMCIVVHGFCPRIILFCPLDRLKIINVNYI
jgi:hypothetical protein